MSGLTRLPAAALALLVLAGCGAGIPFVTSADSEPVLKGTVSYRERIALPRDSMLVVSLTDTSPVIVTTRIIAEAVLRVDGKAPPIPFELPYDRARIVSDRYYGVRAAIRSGDRILFETSGAYPVITRGNPKRVELELVRGAADAALAVPTLVGSAWRLEDLAGAGTLDRVEATIEFPEAGRVAGVASCNRFFGYFETSGTSLTIARLGATKKLCPPALMDQEAKYLRALEGAERFAIEGTTFTLYSQGLDKPLRFVKK
jgi:heat shock protein HslJ